MSVIAWLRQLPLGPSAPDSFAPGSNNLRLKPGRSIFWQGASSRPCLLLPLYFRPKAYTLPLFEPT